MFPIRPTPIVLLLLAGLLFHTSQGIDVQAQQRQDTLSINDSVLKKKHNPRKATIYSTILPGLGQIYNRKYWKVPVIYAGFGVMSYFIYMNTDEYLTFKCAYIERKNGITNGNYASLASKYEESELLSAVEYYRRNLEISVLVTALWYVLNIIDAAVDAHLYTYNIDENLSFQVLPELLPSAFPSGMRPGLKLCLKF